MRRRSTTPFRFIHRKGEPWWRNTYRAIRRAAWRRGFGKRRGVR